MNGSGDATCEKVHISFTFLVTLDIKWTSKMFANGGYSPTRSSGSCGKGGEETDLPSYHLQITHFRNTFFTTSLPHKIQRVSRTAFNVSRMPLWRTLKCFSRMNNSVKR